MKKQQIVSTVGILCNKNIHYFPTKKYVLLAMIHNLLKYI